METNPRVKKAYETLTHNLKQGKLFNANQRKNFFYGLILINLSVQSLDANFELLLDEFCREFYFSFYFAKELMDTFPDSRILPLLKKSLLSVSPNLFQELNLQYINLRSSEHNPLTVFQTNLSKYLENFDSTIVLAKGQRRDEDIWLLEAVKQLDRLGQEQHFVNQKLKQHLLMFGRKKSPYNFDLMIELVRCNKILGNFMMNERIFTQDDLKGNQYETLGPFFFLERLLLMRDEGSSQ